VNVTGKGGEVTDTVAPSVPTALKASGVTTSQVTLTWAPSTDNVGVHHYEVYRNGVQVQIPAGTSFVDTGLAANTTYEYKVRAVDKAGNKSAFSTALSVTTQKVPTVDTQAPTAPQNLHSMGETETSVSLMWSPATDNVAVTGYHIFRDGVKVATATGTTYNDTGLKANTTYNYTVKAVDASGNVSGASNTLVAKTKAPVVTPGETTWKADQVYVGGNTVKYNGLEYRAKWWTRGETPGVADVWELVSNVTQTWSPTKAYTGGTRVTHDGVTYQAKWWTQGEKPGVSPVWVVVK
ncbi:MAG: fibronectin type III domain-containing protein, partial [Bacilli bacterium]